MSTTNTMIIQGNLCDDPDLRRTNGGKPVTHLRVATDERVQVNNEWESRPEFFTVIVWGNLAENVAHSLHKGNRVTVVARVKNRTYRPDEGDTRYFTELIAEEVAVSLKWAVIEGEISRSTATRELVPAGGGEDTVVYGDTEPF